MPNSERGLRDAGVGRGRAREVAQQADELRVDGLDQEALHWSWVRC